MKTVITWLMFLTLLIGLMPGAMAQNSGADNPEARAKIAREYIKVVPPRKLVEQLAASLIRRVPQDKQQEIYQKLMTSLDLPAMEQINVEILTQTFTSEELQAMTSFYTSKVGQSIYMKTPQYSTELAKRMLPVILQSLQKVAQEAGLVNPQQGQGQNPAPATSGKK